MGRFLSFVLIGGATLRLLPLAEAAAPAPALAAELVTAALTLSLLPLLGLLVPLLLLLPSDDTLPAFLALRLAFCFSRLRSSFLPLFADFSAAGQVGVPFLEACLSDAAAAADAATELSSMMMSLLLPLLLLPLVLPLVSLLSSVTSLLLVGSDGLPTASDTIGAREWQKRHAPRRA